MPAPTRVINVIDEQRNILPAIHIEGSILNAFNFQAGDELQLYWNNGSLFIKNISIAERATDQQPKPNRSHEADSF
ncbi:hypothetical protein [Rhodoflexus caldus]|uniref:hypothetical protein n=1 Tax=Rhodoflexus caldus TaxID=2891236 RepID=UPI002029DA5A|nr:hypothetical protein [Rhodoflexus caldus]